MVEINKEELRKALEWALKESESLTRLPSGSRYIIGDPVVYWFLEGALAAQKLMQGEQPVHPMLTSVMNVYKKVIDPVPSEDSLPHNRSIFQEPSIIDPLARFVGLE